MLITKAYITKKPDEGDNVYKVNVPLMMDNTETEAEFEALASMSPGIYNGLEEGDCVFVSFEDDKYNTAIILGKLFVDIPESTTAVGLFNQLEVTGSVVLPESTKIGKYSPQDIFNLFQGVDLKEGGGTIDPDVLKKYVQWTGTDRIVEDPETGEQDEVEIFADHIRVMTGKEYDDYKINPEEFDEEEFNQTLYFLSSLPETDDIIDENTGGGSSG